MDIKQIIAALKPSPEYYDRCKSINGMKDAIKSNLNQLVPSNEAYQQARAGNPKALAEASLAAALNAPMAGTFKRQRKQPC